MGGQYFQKANLAVEKRIFVVTTGAANKKVVFRAPKIQVLGVNTTTRDRFNRQKIPQRRQGIIHSHGAGLCR
jgi:hypothetical protein